MNILYIWDADYPWDVRVEKICMTLKDNGHNVHIAARNLKGLNEEEEINGLHIHRLKSWGNNQLNYILSFPAFFSPFWGSLICNIIKVNSIDIIIVRDLPMSIAGIWAGKMYSVKVVLDMAEDYVAMIKNEWSFNKIKVLNILVRNPYLAKFVEKYTLKQIDHVLVVVDEAKELLTNKGVSKDKITIVSNTPTKALLKINPVMKNEILERIAEHFSIIYTGGIQMSRGIQVVFDAIPQVIRDIPKILFVIVGSGYAEQFLKEYMFKKGIENYVFWAGWVEHNRIAEYIRSSKIGIIPHFTTEHTNSTIPNKIFDYMGLGLQIIASDATPLKRVLINENCGLYFKNCDSNDLAKKILEIYNTDIDYGRNGHDAVMRTYNWDQDAERLINVIARMNV